MKYRLGLFLLTAASLQGCLAASEGNALEIQHVIAPDDACKFATTNNFLPEGYYDPMLLAKAGVAPRYTLPLLLRNNLQKRDDDPVMLGTVNVRGRTGGAHLVGFEGCWYRYAGDVTKFGTFTNGAEIVDCATIPNQSGTILASQNLDEGGDAQLAGISILELAHLKSIFGDSFDPAAIPDVGEVSVTDMDNVTRDYFSRLPSPPTDPATRAQAWGERWPTSYEAPVVVQLRAITQLQSGQTLRSNWFPFLIKICMGCLYNGCPALEKQTCNRGACPDGSNCPAGTNGVCPNNTGVCAPVPLFSGNLPTPSACLPAQFGGVACSAPVGCLAP
ncbi:MAG TPA: hypothetical protein VFH51_03120 [Myxococcota bacterium]|nr:hypothetical protein [Myxococcota bacterium]